MSLLRTLCDTRLTGSYRGFFRKSPVNYSCWKSVFFIMSTTITNTVALDSLAETFIDQCLEYLHKNCYDRKSLVQAATEIENSLHSRDWCVEVDGIQYHGKTNPADPIDIWMVSSKWWEAYENLETDEERDYVMNYIKDVFPDAWRP